jgi:hypothetical protein
MGDHSQSVAAIAEVSSPMTLSLLSAPGLFVPNPSAGPSCQGHRTPDLGRGVHCRPPASVVGRGGSYSVGYSAQARSAGGPDWCCCCLVAMKAGSDPAVYQAKLTSVACTRTRSMPVSGGISLRQAWVCHLAT